MKNLLYMSLVFLLGIVSSCNNQPSEVFNSKLRSLQAGTTISFSADTSAPSVKFTDGDVGLVKDGTEFWTLYSGGGANEGVIYRYKGTTMDDLVAQPNGTKDTSFNRPNGDDKYWFMGVWRDISDGKWYSLVHVEFKYGSTSAPNFTHFRRIGLATSTNKGATWHYEGDIITSNNSYNIADYASYDYYDWGVGDQKLYVDNTNGYFYTYYMKAWVNKTTGLRWQSMRVARCPISSKMAPGCWKKWYGNSWIENGLGGKDKDVFMNADSSTVFFNTYLNKFMAIGLKTISSNDSFYSTATNLATQNWTAQDRMSNGSNVYWYNFPVDASNRTDRMTVGQAFRLYSVRADTQASKYMTVTLGSGTTTPVNYASAYPPQCLPDPNPEWCNRALNKAATSSSQYSAGYAPGYAVDGSNNTVSSGGWSPKENDPSDLRPWWEVDLGVPITISSIELVTRQGVDQPITRRNIEVWASNNLDMSLGHVVLGSIGPSGIPYQSTWIQSVSNSTKYRYVAFVKTANEYFFIAEARVLGSP